MRPSNHNVRERSVLLTTQSRQSDALLSDGDTSCKLWLTSFYFSISQENKITVKCGSKVNRKEGQGCEE